MSLYLYTCSFLSIHVYILSIPIYPLGYGFRSWGMSLVSLSLDIYVYQKFSFSCLISLYLYTHSLRSIHVYILSTYLHTPFLFSPLGYPFRGSLKTLVTLSRSIYILSTSIYISSSRRLSLGLGLLFIERETANSPHPNRMGSYKWD